MAKGSDNNEINIDDGVYTEKDVDIALDELAHEGVANKGYGTSIL